jgi:hypothetical protein
MWLPNDLIAEIDKVARFHYVSKLDCKVWNEHRREGELRLLTGWCWQAKHGGKFQLGLKTRTACYRDAYYALVARTDTPSLSRPRLRVVASEKRSA